MRRFVSLFAVGLLSAVMFACGPGYIVVDAPSPQVRERPSAPSAAHVWVDGHHQWRANLQDYVWVPGRWVAARRGQHWKKGRYKWRRRSGYRYRVWVSGRWVQRGVKKVVVVDRAVPPRPKVVRSARPGAGHRWVAGHWVWKPALGKYKWRKGRWVRVNQGKKWVKGHYEWKRSGNHRYRVWVAGHWAVGGGVVRPGPGPKVVVVDRSHPRARPKFKRPRRPRRGNHAWVDGHWVWSNGHGKYKWVRGRWVRTVAKKKWVKGHYEWKRHGKYRHKVWVPGHWVVSGGVVKAGHGPKVVVVDRAHPRARPKFKRPRRPRRGKWVWTAGHWNWKPAIKKYKWTRGRWVKVKAKKRWIAGHYEWKRAGKHRYKVWVPGHWR